MDVVITYVDMTDPVWVEQYRTVVGDQPNIKRFKDLGTINLQIQCIRKFMSWVDNIFVIVSTKSQARHIKGATIITHDQIIPKKYLPTFNSCTIELFLHKIPGLSDYFIYFNDDIFPIDYLDETEFFNERPVLSFKTVHEKPINVFRHQCKNSSNLARLLTGLNPSTTFIKPDHICLVHSKSVYETVWKKISKTLLNSITVLRQPTNYNQYLFVDYLFYSGQCRINRLDYKYVSYSSCFPKYIYDVISSHCCKLVCLHDDIDNDEYNKYLQLALTSILN